MKVFIENEAGSNQKNIFNEQTLELIRTIQVARKYPFPYGFVLDTLAEDGDNVDVFVITDQKLTTGQIIECQPIALMEQFEMSWDQNKANQEEIDHNVIAVLDGGNQDAVPEGIKIQLSEFVKHVFDHVQLNKTRIGDFLSKNSAIEYIQAHQIKR